MFATLLKEIARSGSFVAAGSALGQAANLVALPFVLANAEPQMMALLGVVTASSPLIAIAITLRLEFDVLRGHTTDLTRPIRAALTLAITALTAGLLLSVIAASFAPEVGRVLVIVTLGAGFHALYSTFEVFAISQNRVKTSGIAAIVSGSTQAGSLVLILALDGSATAIALTFACGRLAGVLTHLIGAFTQRKALFKPGWGYIRDGWRRGLVVSPSYLLSNLNLALPVFAAALWGSSFTGEFSTGRRLIVFPVMLVANAMSVVLPTALRRNRVRAPWTVVSRLGTAVLTLAVIWTAATSFAVIAFLGSSEWAGLQSLLVPLGIFAMAQGASTPALSLTTYASMDSFRLHANAIRLTLAACVLVGSYVAGLSGPTAYSLLAVVAAGGYLIMVLQIRHRNAAALMKSINTS